MLLFNSDYHKKKNTLAALRKKALDKNPDEFYFKMISSQLQVRLEPSPEQQNDHHDLNINYYTEKKLLTLSKSWHFISVVVAFNVYDFFVCLVDRMEFT